MHSDIAYYSQINPQFGMPAPSSIHTSQLFDQFSLALSKKLQELMIKNKKKKVEQCQLRCRSDKSIKQREVQIIDLLSQEEVEQKQLCNNKYEKYLNNQHLEQENNQIKYNKNEDITDLNKLQGLCRTSSEIFKQLHQKYYEPNKQINKSSYLQDKYLVQQEYQNFTVKCPKIGILNSELLQKKQKLLARKVVDWASLHVKGPKQRREIKMLKH